MHAEAVLLIDHGERQVRERDALLHQRVGSDHEVDRSVRDRLQHRGPLLAGDGTGQRRVRHRRPRLLTLQERCLLALRRLRLCRAEADGADRREERFHRAAVLAGEDLGRRHDRRLMAGLDRDQRRVHRHDRFARADVSLQQRVHRPGCRHRPGDLLDRSLLCAGELEREMIAECSRERSFHVMTDAGCLRLHPVLAERDAELEDEQLVELQPLAGGVEHLLRLGEVDRADRFVERGQPLGTYDV